MARMTFSFILASFSIALSANAAVQPIPCLSVQAGTAIGNTDAWVPQWKAKMGTRVRGNLFGIFTRILPSNSTHTHFEMRVPTVVNGAMASSDVVEVVYNDEFGSLPRMHQGSTVEACGDFITVNNSPDRAIIHWVHYNPGNRDNGRHEHGFLNIDGIYYGVPPAVQARYSRAKFYSH